MKDFETRDGAGQARPLGTALVFTDDYFPTGIVRISAQLPASITVDVLNGPDDRGVPVIETPSDYVGYLITYDFAPGSRFGLLFTRRYLRPGRRFRLGTEATMFNDALNLIRMPLIEVPDGG